MSKMQSLIKNQEMKVYGRHACMTIFSKRPQDVIRAYVTQDGIFEFKPLIRHCVDQKLAYHVVTKEELDNLTRATHHEGIALVVKTKKLPTLRDLFGSKGKSLIIALEEVENPHNLGAIMRSCAHFGVTGIVYEAPVPVALSAAAFRTSEGGAESVPAIQVKDWAEVLEVAKNKGFKTFATSSHKGESLFSTQFPEKTLLFLGAEKDGLSEKLTKSLSTLISIPGTGSVESLNVSNATASVLTEWYRQSH